MSAKSKYVIVKMASVISGTQRIWVKERAAPKVQQILFDPAIGQDALFEESKRVKGKSKLTQYVKDMYKITDSFKLEEDTSTPTKKKKKK